MAKRNVGAVCLVVSFARQPLRAEGLGGDAGADAVFRRPSGLRGRSQLRLAVGRVLCPSVLAGHSRVRPPPLLLRVPGSVWPGKASLFR